MNVGSNKNAVFEKILDVVVAYRFSPNCRAFGLTFKELIPPENDKCNNAVDILPNQPLIIITVRCATFKTFCDDGSELPSVWYTIDGTRCGLWAFTCYNLTNSPTDLSLYTGPCNMLECISGMDSSNSPCPLASVGSILSWNSVLGVTNFIVILGDTSDGVKVFGITLTEFQSPSNDQSLNANMISNFDDSTFIGSTANTTTNLDVAGSCSVLNTPGMWFSLLGNGSRVILSTYTPNCGGKISW